MAKILSILPSLRGRAPPQALDSAIINTVKMATMICSEGHSAHCWDGALAALGLAMNAQTRQVREQRLHPAYCRTRCAAAR